MLRRSLLRLSLLILAVIAVCAWVTTLPPIGTVQPAVILGTLVCAAGVVVHSVGLRDAIGDLAYADRKRLGKDYQTVALGDIRTEVARLIVKVLLTLAGLSLMLTVPDTETTRFVLSVGMLPAVTLLTLESSLDTGDRRRMRRTE